MIQPGSRACRTALNLTPGHAGELAGPSLPPGGSDILRLASPAIGFPARFGAGLPDVTSWARRPSVVGPDPAARW